MSKNHDNSQVISTDNVYVSILPPPFFNPMSL